MAEPEQQAQENLGAALTLERRVDVYPETPLPEFSGPDFRAYAARLKGDAHASLMALVCTGHLPPRVDIVNAMRTIDCPSMLRLREGGVLLWPAQQTWQYTLAYERPLTSRYWQQANETHAPMNEDAINQHFVTPMVSALSELQRTGVVHGALRLTNIYWREGGATPPQLGECLTAPAGLHQPVLYETIERGMCMPLGRGAGQHLDDCYAFGVALALVVLGHNPLHNLDDRGILQAKMEHGSFGALVGNRRLATSHVEVLRGLLTDDARQRWNATDLEQWLTGRRLTPKNTDAGKRANRHISFAGKEYWQVRPLANAMAANVGEAVKIVEDNTLGKWLSRSFGDEDRAEAIENAIMFSKEGGKTSHYEDRLVTRACIALDPAAPIRYRGLALLPGGIAALLADAIQTGAGAQIISEVISSQFPTFWVNQQKEIKTDLVPLAQLLERMRDIIERTSYGNGLERAAYELNPSLPCLSPMTKSHYLLGTKRLLLALESIATSPSRPAEPMDRHLAAFLIVRDKRSEALFSSMSPSEPPVRRGLALLTLFSEMQYRYGPDQLPGIASWIFPLVETAIKRFLSKPFQEKVKKQAREAIAQGDLSKLLNIVDDPERIERDEQDFEEARRMYADIRNEIADLEHELSHKNAIAQTVGRPVAATIATIAALLLIAFSIGRAMWHSLG